MTISPLNIQADKNSVYTLHRQNAKHEDLSLGMTKIENGKNNV